MSQLPHLNRTALATDSRTQRLITAQELLLEYSLVIVLLGCFIVVSLSSKMVRELGAPADGLFLL